MGRVKDVLSENSINDAVDLTKNEIEVLSTMVFKFSDDKEFQDFAKRKGVNIKALAKKLR